MRGSDHRPKEGRAQRQDFQPHDFQPRAPRVFPSQRRLKTHGKDRARRTRSIKYGALTLSHEYL